MQARLRNDLLPRFLTSCSIPFIYIIFRNHYAFDCFLRFDGPALEISLVDIQLRVYSEVLTVEIVLHNGLPFLQRTRGVLVRLYAMVSTAAPRTCPP